MKILVTNATGNRGKAFSVPFFTDPWCKGRPFLFIIVLIGLYALTKYDKANQLSDDLRHLLGREPISFAGFVKDHRLLALEAGFCNERVSV